MPAQIVVTGLGVVSPIGIGVSEFWKAALDGRSGVSAITGFDPFPMDGYRSRIAAQIHGFAPERYLDSVQAERVDRYAQFALVATKEALADSGLQLPKENPRRIGVIVGAGMGGMVMGEREITQLYQSQRPHRVHPNFIPVITLNSASGIVAMAHGAKGPNYTISTACSSSAHALGQAMQCIREGRADVVITVGADASITPLVFAGFCSLRALSTKYNDQPERASRPFDRLRDGFVMGEGAGALVLESSAHAKKRKARIYAEVAGYAATSEAYHMVIPREDGEDIASTMRLALADAGCDRLHQRACHIHLDRRRGRSQSHPSAFSIARRQDCDQRDKVARRPHAGSGRSPCRHCHSARHPHRADPSDRQLRGAGSGLCLAGHYGVRAGTEGQGGATQRLWFRQ
jgi:3-oxoacyl-[acyl-carrier-protein] synthase II